MPIIFFTLPPAAGNKENGQGADQKENLDLFTSASVTRRLAKPTTAGRHERVPRVAATISVNRAIMNNPADRSSGPQHAHLHGHAAGENQQEAAKRRDTSIANERLQQIRKRHRRNAITFARVACVHASAKPRVAQGRYGGRLHVHTGRRLEQSQPAGSAAGSTDTRDDRKIPAPAGC